MSKFALLCSLVLMLGFKGFMLTTATNTTGCNINELKDLLEDVKQSCDKRYKNLEEKFDSHVSRRSLAGGIAFSARLTAHQMNIALGTTIKFDKVHINDGSGFDLQTGVFTAPEAGVYMFSYFIGHGITPAQAWMGLKHNGQRINSAVTDTFHTNEDVQGGNMAIMRLGVGDRVWIESFHTNNAYLDGRNGFTSFTGLYLYS